MNGEVPKYRAMKVQGMSMQPYLRAEDVVWVELGDLDTDFTPGEILVARTGGLPLLPGLPELPNGDVPVIHRVTQGGQLKGDRARVFDGPLECLEIQGRVVGRLSRSGNGRWVSYRNPVIRRAHRFQASLSRWNRASRYPVFAKGVATLLALLGWSLRLSEEWIFSRSFQPSSKSDPPRIG